jgi:hypothetical protein
MTYAEQALAVGQAADSTIAGLQIELDQANARIAELEAQLSPWELLFTEDWSNGIDASRWFISGGTKFDKTHAEVIDGALYLDHRLTPQGVWKGALVGLREPLTYGKVEVECYLDPGSFRGVGLLWPKSDIWPEDGEIDFFEIGGDQPQRLTNTQTVHYGTAADHGMIHTAYTDEMPFTQPHTIGVEWTPGLLVYTCNGVEMARVENENVPSGPMKPHFQSAKPGGSLSATAGSFVVKTVRVSKWKTTTAT